MLTVVAALAIVIVIGGAGFITGRDGSPTAKTDGSKTSKGRRAGQQATSEVPGTMLITGASTTVLFVTTTTPITTTTSTTTPEPPIAASGSAITFTAGQRSAEFTIRTSNPDGLGFAITGVPRGLSASPVTGIVKASSPVRIVLTITNLAVAESGTVVIVGSDGSRVPVRVTMAADALSVSSISFDPDPPMCGQSIRIVAQVSGQSIDSVTAVLRSASGTTGVAMGSADQATWTANLPAAAVGTVLAGSVIVAGSDGTTVSQAFSTTVSGGPGCTG